MTKLQRAALALAKRNLAVFPCRPRDKIPLTKHGCKDATTDAAVITRWWQQRPEANIGIATGSKSGVWVLDVDGDEGEASLRAIEAKHAPLPPTIEAITGNGGRHLYFRLPNFDGPPTIKNSVKQLGAELDTRATGGYVIAPPSIHPNGRQYAWSIDTASKLADPPVWLVALIALPVNSNANGVERHPDHWSRIVHDGAVEGQRNATAASLTGYLLRQGLDARTTLDLVLGWNLLRNRPPLADHEILGVVRSITARELARKRNIPCR